MEALQILVVGCIFVGLLSVWLNFDAHKKIEQLQTAFLLLSSNIDILKEMIDSLEEDLDELLSEEKDSE